MYEPLPFTSAYFSHFTPASRKVSGRDWALQFIPSFKWNLFLTSTIFFFLKIFKSKWRYKSLFEKQHQPKKKPVTCSKICLNLLSGWLSCIIYQVELIQKQGSCLKYGVYCDGIVRLSSWFTRNIIWRETRREAE